jgi:hypothetical protein
MLVFLVGCGGATDGDRGAGVGGQGGAAGSAGMGAGGTPAPCSAPQPLVTCVRDYCPPGEVAFGAECRDGVWQCPSGRIPQEQCPPDSCFSNPGFFCCDAEGGQHAPICTNHGAPICEPGLTKSELGQLCKAPPGCEQTGCATTDLCDFKDSYCGSISPGVCVPKPTQCDAKEQPVCGCDSQIYANECEAHLAGVDLGMSCTAPTGFHLCGASLCLLGVEYCEISGADEQSACKPLPAGCGTTPTCACLSGLPCASQCSDGGGGYVKLTCK